MALIHGMTILLNYFVFQNNLRSHGKLSSSSASVNLICIIKRFKYSQQLSDEMREVCKQNRRTEDNYMSNKTHQQKIIINNCIVRIDKF